MSSTPYHVYGCFRVIVCVELIDSLIPNVHCAIFKMLDKQPKDTFNFVMQ